MRKTTPDTSCREQARELCAPRGCAEKQVSIKSAKYRPDTDILHFSVTAVKTR